MRRLLVRRSTSRRLLTIIARLLVKHRYAIMILFHAIGSASSSHRCRNSHRQLNRLRFILNKLIKQEISLLAHDLVDAAVQPRDGEHGTRRPLPSALCQSHEHGTNHRWQRRGHERFFLMSSIHIDPVIIQTSHNNQEQFQSTSR